MGVSDGWDEWRERIGGRAVLVSLLVHILLLALIWLDVQWFASHEDPPAIEVELTPEPPAQPHPKPPPEQPKADQPEPPKPPEPKPPEPKPPEPKQAEKPPEPKPEVAAPQPKPPPPDVKPGPRPILDPGKLAKESHEGKRSWLDDSDTPEPKKTTLGPSSSVAVPTQAMDVGKGERQNDDTGGPATQSERDFLLAQILNKWKRPFGTWPPDAVVRLRVRVLPDGYLAPPFDARMGYAPASAIVGYGQMGRGDPRLAVLETLYVAIRVSQPLTLAPELRAKAPFEIALDFKLNDVN